MPYLIPNQESHPPGYNGLYSAVELKKGIINFISIDREKNGNRLLATADIILGLKTMYNIEFDFHSVEYVMRNMMTSEGSKQVGTEPLSSVVKKCEDGIEREFACSPPRPPPPARAKPPPREKQARASRAAPAAAPPASRATASPRARPPRAPPLEPLTRAHP